MPSGPVRNPEMARPGRELVERGGIRALPAQKGGPVGIVGLDDEPLAAVVHAQAQRGPAALDELHAEKVFAETRPILEVAGTQPDIAERLQCHVRLLIAGASACRGSCTASVRFR